jgi:hypothetical protein
MFEGTVLVSVPSKRNVFGSILTDFFLMKLQIFRMVLTELLKQSPKSSGMLHCIESLTDTSVYSSLHLPSYYLEIKASVPVQHWYLSFIHSVTSQKPEGFVLFINCCQLIFLFVTGLHRDPR